MGDGMELFDKRRDGLGVPGEIALNSLNTLLVTMVVAAIRDISDRKKFSKIYVWRMSDLLSGPRLLAETH